VDLDFLGLDRIHDIPRSFSETEEDILSTKLQKLGPK
jgi:hypothetical protein